MYKIFSLVFLIFVLEHFPQEVTESAVTVPLNSIQVETGFQYNSFRKEGFIVDNYSIAATIFRYGISEKIELRSGAAYLIRKSEIFSTSGFGNFRIGSKINFLSEKKDPLNFAVMINALLPVGKKTFRPEKIEPEMLFAFSKSFIEKILISSNLHGAYSNSINDFAFLYATSVRFLILKNFGALLEVYGNFSSLFFPDHLYNAGVYYLIFNNLQIDFSGGKSFSMENHWFIGTEVSLGIK